MPVTSAPAGVSTNRCVPVATTSSTCCWAGSRSPTPRSSAGVAVARTGAGRGRRRSLVDAGQGRDHLVPLEGAREVVQVVDEDLARVHERADDDPLGQREVVEHGLAERREPLQRAARVEAVGGERAAGDGAGVQQRAARAQGAREHGVDLERGLERELVVALAGAAGLEAHGPQQDGRADGARRAPRAARSPDWSRWRVTDASAATSSVATSGVVRSVQVATPIASEVGRIPYRCA